MLTISSYFYMNPAGYVRPYLRNVLGKVVDTTHAQFVVEFVGYKTDNGSLWGIPFEDVKRMGIIVIDDVIVKSKLFKLVDFHL